MANEKRILNVHDWRHYKTRVEAIRVLIENTGKDYQKVLESFNNDEIVNSLYASGKFGETQRRRVEQLMTALDKYFKVINDGEDSLVNQTLAYADTQIQLLESGTQTSAPTNTQNSNIGYYN